MKLLSYAIADKDAHGNLYAVVSLDSGATFGQWLQPGPTADLDEQVQQAIDRQTAVAVATSMPVGTVRTETAISAAIAAAKLANDAP